MSPSSVSTSTPPESPRPRPSIAYTKSMMGAVGDGLRISRIATSTSATIPTTERIVTPHRCVVPSQMAKPAAKMSVSISGSVSIGFLRCEPPKKSERIEFERVIDRFSANKRKPVIRKRNTPKWLK